ncbi:hypothetical protein FW778_06255 [Ginsengibacter hankyongi]|uniref:Uncharacterized protein n=1 Tax=Ginsengibacter hankyongi TaxID=2607284 RepID=A0A5J5IKT7_9BACT|nr:VapE domain-containing protein [Ginsengibacter hankyongi]KAA9041620.1 hypothetical protein FW778_06255 [Ginsengibacter hankyongi]
MEPKIQETANKNACAVQHDAGTADAKLYFGKDVLDSKSCVTIPIGIFLDNVQGDTYQEYVFKVRSIKDKDARTDAKKTGVPIVCISGCGNSRTNAGITEHSGFIGMDADDVPNIQAIKKQLRNDPYVYACFVSISNTGLCIIFKIVPDKHREAFEGLRIYLYEKYKLTVDERCKEISRARFVSYDPSLILNEKSKVFKLYPKRETAAARKENSRPAIGVKSDFENVILKEIEERGIDLVPSYGIWLNVGFAIANQFKEDGRDYFHRISAFGDYDKAMCDKQYDACLYYDRKRDIKNHAITINFFFNICKAAGITTESPETAMIKKAAYTQKQAGCSSQTIINNLEKFVGFSPEQTIDIVTQVMEKDYVNEDTSDMECIREFLKANYTLRINEITNRLENDNKELTNYEIHSIELAIKEKFPKTDYTTIGKILDSNFIHKYHPIFEFFKKNVDYRPTGAIDELFACIKTNTGDGICEDAVGEEYARYFGKKWMVGMVACLYENVSPLMLILCGMDQGTGKTFFFENFLPKELSKYCTIKNLSSLTSDTFKRDMDIAISRYWLIYDDEMSGKSKRDQGAIKALLSTGGTNVRAAYAKAEESRKRIATFGGTTNDLQILGDHTGNRRFIPIEVLSIDFERKDRINPVDYIMEAYHLYHDGFQYNVLGSDMKLLNSCTAKFTQIQTEFEMVIQLYKKPLNEYDTNGVYRTATDIRNRIELFSKEKINPNKLSAALRAIDIEGKQRKIEGVFASWYFVVEKRVIINRPEFECISGADDLPF